MKAPLTIIAVALLSGCTMYGPWEEATNPDDGYYQAMYTPKVFRRAQSPRFCLLPVVADVPDQFGVMRSDGKIVPVTSWSDK
jgi:hypothetical protein